MATEVRIQGNKWLRSASKSITGKVLSIGSADDNDQEGGRYRHYFSNADSYLTSTLPGDGGDLILDARDMKKEVANGEYDCIFCSGVLEHIFECQDAMSEMTRILKSGGILLLGVPFRQAIHMAPNDYWRFTRFALKKMLNPHYHSIEIADICDGKAAEAAGRSHTAVGDGAFPITYLVKAVKK